MELTREFFIQRYVVEKKSSVEIAKEVGKASNTIRARMVALGIPLRDRKTASLLERSIELDPDQLQRLYLEDHKSPQIIADELGVTRRIVLGNLERLGIYEAKRTYGGEDHWMRGKTQSQESIEKAKKTRKERGLRYGPEPRVIEERFWPKIEKTNSCWNWMANKNNHGYGMVLYGDRKRLAHRISWELHNGKIPKGLCVLHKCDNPACVNPDHLFLGTIRDNYEDMVKKGRHPPPSNQFRQIPKAEVERIRELYQEGYSQIALVRMFGLHRSTISGYVHETRRKLV